MAPRGRILAEARFDPKLKLYLYLQGALGFAASFVGIPFLPFWLVLGRTWASRYFEALECTLTDRALKVSKGVWFRSESTVPLDRIQDLSIRHGPFLDRLGLAKIRVETAGGGQGDGSGIDLTGIVDTVAFRDLVLEARDRASGFLDAPEEAPAGDALAGRASAGHGPGGERRLAAGTAPAVGGDASAVLVDIRDALVRIETLLAERGRP